MSGAVAQADRGETENMDNTINNNDKQLQHHHAHHHSPEHNKAVANRLARAIGHLEAIKRMVEDDRDCSEILIQLMAVKAALNNTGKVILKEHMEHCVIHAIEEGDYEALAEFNKALEQFL